MDKWLIIVCIVLAVLVVGVGGGSFVYGNYRYDAGQQAGYQAGYDAYANPEDPGPAIGEAYDAGSKAGYNEAYGEVAERIILPADATVDDIKARLDELAVAPRVRNSTEVVSFLWMDTTNNNTYDTPYAGPYFARDLRINALDQGFKTGKVSLIVMEAIYALVVFDTSDLGLLFFDPTSDLPMSVRVGESFAAQNGWPKPPFDDEIVDVVIDW